ncbi:hypothetical protein QFC24_002998 [Naganishia onofrii]|uniref:Uncharacterized protein n=1 Tax=Naganishia onofrii TaxID=1851511 RepID=A0ACC2XNN9_9TREE|nr:hypothetical protein QFC24_002998 [Naganishia onofrii]
MNLAFKFRFRLDWKHHRRALQQALGDAATAVMQLPKAPRVSGEESDIDVVNGLIRKLHADLCVKEKYEYIGVKGTLDLVQLLLLFGLGESAAEAAIKYWRHEELREPKYCYMKVRQEIQAVLNDKVVGTLLHPPAKLRGWSRIKQTLSSSLSRLTRSSKATDAVSLPGTRAPTPSGTRSVAGSGATGQLTVSVSPSVPVPPTFQRTFGSTAASGGVPSAVPQPDGPSEQ